MSEFVIFGGSFVAALSFLVAAWLDPGFKTGKQAELFYPVEAVAALVPAPGAAQTCMPDGLPKPASRPAAALPRRVVIAPGAVAWSFSGENAARAIAPRGPSFIAGPARILKRRENDPVPIANEEGGSISADVLRRYRSYAAELARL